MTRWRCRAYRALAVDYAEGRLSGRQQARLERHLARCPACTDEVEVLRQLPAVLKRVAVPDPGEDFWQHQGEAIGLAIRNLPDPAVPRQAARGLGGLQWSAWRLPVAATVALLLAVVAYRLAERPPRPLADNAAPAVAALDPQSLVSLDEFMESLVPHGDTLAATSPDAETVLAALPVEDVIEAGFLPEPPQATDLTDDELDGVGNLVGGIG